MYQRHWLVRPKTIRILWMVFIAILVALVAAGFLVTVHPIFEFDGMPGFYAAYGFLACVLLVIVAKLLGMLIKRPDDYYDG